MPEFYLTSNFLLYFYLIEDLFADPSSWTRTISENEQDPEIPGQLEDWIGWNIYISGRPLSSFTKFV